MLTFVIGSFCFAFAAIVFGAFRKAHQIDLIAGKCDQTGNNSDVLVAPIVWTPPPYSPPGPETRQTLSVTIDFGCYEKDLALGQEHNFLTAKLREVCALTYVPRWRQDCCEEPDICVRVSWRRCSDKSTSVRAQYEMSWAQIVDEIGMAQYVADGNLPGIYHISMVEVDRIRFIGDLVKSLGYKRPALRPKYFSLTSSQA